MGVRRMPRRKPFTLPLTPAEQQVVQRLREITREALESHMRGDDTLFEKMREDVRDIMQGKHDALSHPHTPETKRRIGLASRIRARTQRRDPPGPDTRWGAVPPPSQLGVPRLHKKTLKTPTEGVGFATI